MHIEEFFKIFTLCAGAGVASYVYMRLSGIIIKTLFLILILLTIGWAASFTTNFDFSTMHASTVLDYVKQFFVLTFTYFGSIIERANIFAIGSIIAGAILGMFNK